jgi:hypothetical protein
VFFILRDHLGRPVATGLSPPILITDDHKSYSKVGTGKQAQTTALGSGQRKRQRVEEGTEAAQNAVLAAMAAVPPGLHGQVFSAFPLAPMGSADMPMVVPYPALQPPSGSASTPKPQLAPGPTTRVGRVGRTKSSIRKTSSGTDLVGSSARQSSEGHVQGVGYLFPPLTSFQQSQQKVHQQSQEQIQHEVVVKTEHELSEGAFTPPEFGNMADQVEASREEDLVMDFDLEQIPLGTTDMTDNLLDGSADYLQYAEAVDSSLPSAFVGFLQSPLIAPHGVATAAQAVNRPPGNAGASRAQNRGDPEMDLPVISKVIPGDGPLHGGIDVTVLGRGFRGDFFFLHLRVVWWPVLT